MVSRIKGGGGGGGGGRAATKIDLRVHPTN